MSSIRILLAPAAAIFVSAVTLFGCTTPIAEHPVSVTRPAYFTEAINMSTPRADHAAVALKDGRVLICGGTKNLNVGSVQSSAEIYDPAQHKFFPTGSMTTPRMGQTATLLDDGRVLIVGGVRNLGFRAMLKSAEIYDPETGSFTATAPMSVAREGHTATLLRDGRVLVAGGSDNGIHTLESAEIYDPKTARWAKTGSMTVPRVAHVAVLLNDGRVLIAGGGRGGRPGGYIAYQNAELFDPRTGKFSAIAAQMKSDRVGPAAVLLKTGRVLIVGGKSGKILTGAGPRTRDLAWFTPLDTAEIFDPETSEFYAASPMRVPHYLPTATLLSDGDVLVVGGWQMRGNVISGMYDAEEFSSGAPGFFSSVGPLSVARLENTATLLPDGRVLVAGGIDAKGKVTSSVEYYLPESHHFARAGELSSASVRIPPQDITPAPGSPPH